MLRASTVSHKLHESAIAVLLGDMASSYANGKDICIALIPVAS